MRTRPWLDTVAASFAAVAPLAMAILHAPIVADGGHDRPTIRALGLGLAGGWRAMDAIVTAPLVLLPLGTRASRAAMASAAALSLLSLVIFITARARLRNKETGLGLFAAFIASSVATLAPSMQIEATSPGGATLGALLALLPRAAFARGSSPLRVALLLGVACGYDPIVGVLALASLLPQLRRPRALGGLVIAFLCGLLPLAIALAARRATESSLDGWGSRHSPLAFAVSELGVVAVGLGVGGLALSLVRRDGRAQAASSVAVIAVSSIAVGAGVYLGPDRYAAAALVLIAETALVAAGGMIALLGFVRDTKVAFAKASSWLVAIILLALPVRQADDAELRLAPKTGLAERAFARVAWESLPLGTLVLVAHKDVGERVLAARAQGDIRSDVSFVRLGHPSAVDAIAREPRLAPLLRDQALYGAPEEWSLSALAAARPVALTFDARWPRALARHLVAAGLFDRFYPEPRGLTDRRVALEELMPGRLALVLALVKSRSPDTAHVTATLLRARLLGAAASGDRDITARALDDLRPFAPADPVSIEIVRRLLTTRGPIDVTDLAR